jgi:pyridinium-3,5-bisthiocarboxylic acid mononucleotide nickel chelatase
MIAWIDAQAGASGDMFLGALVGAGVPLEVLQQAVSALGLGIELESGICNRRGIGAVKIDVRSADTATSRGLTEIISILQRVAEPARAVAVEAFRRLGEAEAAVHRVPVEEVHFHEVGAYDCLADIVGTAAGFAHLGVSEIHCSRVSLGSGAARSAHGPIPIPGPAVLRLLAGVPVTAGPARMESTTPTGAALLATVVTNWGDLPPMSVTDVGYGAGTANPAEVANVLRLVIGEPAPYSRTTVLLETNIDDLDPRLWPHTIDRLLGAGAHDAWLSPILMKKGRPAHTLSVLCDSTDVDQIRAVVYRETSTIGMREIAVDKHTLRRTEQTILVQDQPIRVKTAWLDGEAVNRNPEWRDVADAAAALGKPAKQILDAARGQPIEAES